MAQQTIVALQSVENKQSINTYCQLCNKTFSLKRNLKRYGLPYFEKVDFMPLKKIHFYRHEEQHLKIVPCTKCGKILLIMHRCEPQLVYATFQLQDGKTGWFPVITGPIPNGASVVEFSRKLIPERVDWSVSLEDIEEFL